MKIRIISILLFCTLISCGKQNPAENKDKIAGYWEINSVKMQDGTKKDFTINTTIDFIEITGNKGIRTKVSPQIDGSFIHHGTAETFNIKIEDDSLRLYYETPYDSWKETIISVTDEALKVLNKDDKIYSYKKFKKFNINQ
jgi:hypothetical protein